MADTFDQLKGHELNPRNLSKQQGDVLYKSLTHFGDLGGITFNVANGKLVGGHMRTGIFNKYKDAKQIHITQRWDEPKSAGTVAVGFIGYGDEYYAYREVMWDEATHLAAMESANRVGGDWDLEKLADVNELIRQQDESLLALTGQTDEELKRLQQLGSSPEEPVDQRDDDRIRIDLRVTDPQSIVVEQAINEMSSRFKVGDGTNDDLRANAIVQICQTYLDNLNDEPDSPQS